MRTQYQVVKETQKTRSQKVFKIKKSRIRNQIFSEKENQINLEKHKKDVECPDCKYIEWIEFNKG